MAVDDAIGWMRADRLSANKAAAQAGERWGVTGRCVQQWAAKQGRPLGALALELSREQRNNAAAAGVASAVNASYGVAERLKLSDEFFAKAREMLMLAAEPKDVYQLSLAFAILTDKRRLEEGLATGRQETIDGGDDAFAAIQRGRERFQSLRGA